MNFNGAISGTGGLSVSAGTTTLSTANSYSGATNVSGTLQLQNAGSIASSALTLNTGATLQLRNDSNTIFTSGAITIGGAPNTASTITIDASELTSAGAGKTLTLGSTLTFATNTTGTTTNTINVTGGNGGNDTLAIGTIVDPSSGGGPFPVVINSTTAAVTIALFQTGSYSTGRASPA